MMLYERNIFACIPHDLMSCCNHFPVAAVEAAGRHGESKILDFFSRL